MSNIALPAAIAQFFAAKSEPKAAGTLDCFTQDATVNDKGEDRILRGVSEIGAWLQGTVSEYKLTTEVVSMEERDGLAVVGVVVAGDFPGSPYRFDYDFTLMGDRISELSITPIGSLAD